MLVRPSVSRGGPYPVHEGAAFHERVRRRKLASRRLSAGQWAELVSIWEAGGESARAFADQDGISEASLRWWKGELARRSRREPARHARQQRGARAKNGLGSACSVGKPAAVHRGLVCQARRNACLAGAAFQALVVLLVLKAEAATDG
jgi:hypothetical protein